MNTSATRTRIVEAVATWSFNTAEELVAALEAALDAANDEGHADNTVLLGNVRAMTLVRETLSDGSTVMNINFVAA